MTTASAQILLLLATSCRSESYKTTSFSSYKRYMVHRNDGTMFLFIIEPTCKDRAVCLSRAVSAYFVTV